MENMINEINDSFLNELEKIKNTRINVENKLNDIKQEIDEKVKIAGDYKSSVEKSRNIISALEGEISSLEKDLSDLENKYADGFEEILETGNKVINSKIKDKKGLIAKESRSILELTDKAHSLKEELINLKEEKHSIEEELNERISLENYYTSKIMAVINYAKENQNELKNYVVVNGTSLVQSDEINDEELENQVDDSVFKEIDEISTTEPDEDLIKEVLSNNDLLEDSTPISSDVDLSMTQQLDDIIASANDILAHNESITSLLPEDYEEEKVEVKEEKVEEPVEDDTLYINVPDEEETPVVEKTDDSLDDSFDLEKLLNDSEEKDLNVPELDLFNLTGDEEEDTNEVTISKAEEKEDTEESEPTTDDVDEALMSIINNVQAESDEEELVLNEDTFKDDSENVRNILIDNGFDATRFDDETLKKIEKNNNQNNLTRLIKTLKKHNIDLSNIYNNSELLTDVTPQNLDQILTLIERTGASKETANMVLSAIPKINVNKLEESVIVNDGAELSQILYDAVDYDNEQSIGDLLDLSNSELNTLRKSAKTEDYEIINLFPEIAEANYKILKGYGVANYKECFLLHPHRFIYNPENFNAILDKYDPEDLIRCVNKNSSVIDKL